MKTDDIIKERIQVETERFKIYIWLVIVITAGNYSLYLNLENNFVNKILLIYGLVFDLFFTFMIIYSYFNTNKLLKDLKGKGGNNV